MSLPTLLKKEYVLPGAWMSSEELADIKNMASIDWIIKYLEKRTTIGGRRELPVTTMGDRVCVLRSGTGTGKSTVLPPYLYKIFNLKHNIDKNIICTQPTVATTVDIPYQIVMYNKEMILGDTIGYQTKAFVNKPIKGLLFATIGVLLQQLKSSEDVEFMRKYSFIVIDEIHTRNIDTDSVLFYMKSFLSRNYKDPNCPYLILMSGTFDPELYMKYFECKADSFVDVVGSSFYIQDNFAKYTVTNYIDYSIKLVTDIHINNLDDFTDNNIFRDILIFVQGAGQSKKIINKIHYLNRILDQGLEKTKDYLGKLPEYHDKTILGGSKNYYLCPIVISADTIEKGEEDYKNLFSNIDSIEIPLYDFNEDGTPSKEIKRIKPTRRVIVGTNAIETGITIETLKYCIDTGYVFDVSYNPIYNCSLILNKNVTKSSSRQRRGRVGRKAEGVFYTCYTKEAYESFESDIYPEILKANITKLMLSIINSQTHTKLSYDSDRAFETNNKFNRYVKIIQDTNFTASKMEFMQFPTSEHIASSIEKLYCLGFIDYNYNPTMFGYYGNKFELSDIELIRIIFAGYQHKANILDLITLVSFIEISKKLTIKGISSKVKLFENNKHFFMNVLRDDLIETILLWNDFMEFIGNNIDEIKLKSDIIKTWTKDRSIDYFLFVKLIGIRDELINKLLGFGMNPYYNGLGIPRNLYNLNTMLKNNLQEGLDEIKKIKKCIYEGFRMNLFTYDGAKYISNYGNYPINVDSQLINNKPKNILIIKISIEQAKSGDVYEINGKTVCVMDDYVPVDYEFLKR